MSEAPERIYLQDAGDYEGAAKLEVTWCVEPQDDADTAYIRADLVEAAVKRAIEACARRIEPHPDHDKADWSEYAWEKHRNAIYIRALASDPEAIAKIIGGDA